MNKILVPTDCSDLSGYALTLAQKFASKTGAEIYALKVVPTSADAVFNKEGDLLKSDSYDKEELDKEYWKSIQSLNEWKGQSGASVKSIVTVGNINDKILDFINKEQIDLVVMGTHGLHGLRELIADSVTGHLIRNSTVPVLSLKCNREGLEVKNIVFANSFDKAVPENLDFIKNVQEVFGAKIHLLRINTSGNFKATRVLEANMTAFVEEHNLKNVENHIYCDKDVETGILHFTEDAHVDLIAIGVEPESINKLFKKHVSSALVNHVYHPVLTFKI